MTQYTSRRYGQPDIHFAKEVFSYFHNYSWPGNVRELKHTIERMVVLSSTGTLTADDIPQPIRRPQKAAANVLLELPETGVDLEEIEKEIVRQALEKNDWNQSAAAKYLNITRSVLISRMQKYGLSPPAGENDSALTTS